MSCEEIHPFILLPNVADCRFPIEVQSARICLVVFLLDNLLLFGRILVLTNLKWL